MLQVDAAFLQTLLRAAESDNQLRVLSADVGLLAGIVNYMSVVRDAVVKGQRGDGTEFTMHLVAKEMPASEERREQFRVPQAFEREAVAYDQVLPMLGTPALSMFPRCLSSKPIVVLEDLRAKGFTMSDRHRGLDLDHCRVAIKGLACLHAQSMALKNRNPVAFHKAADLLKNEPAFVDEAEQTFGVGLENAFTMALTSLEDLEATDNAVKTALAPLKPLRGCVFRTITKLLRPKKDLSIVCHGDCNVTNLLFRYSTDGIPEEVKFLDLQAMRYSSLATDILYLLFTGAQTHVRRFHWTELMELYHRELQRESGVSVPLELLQKEMKEHALYGLLCALWLLPVLSTAPEEDPNIQHSENYYEDAKREWTKKLVDTPYVTLARDLILDWNNF